MSKGCHILAGDELLFTSLVMAYFNPVRLPLHVSILFGHCITAPHCSRVASHSSRGAQIGKGGGAIDCARDAMLCFCSESGQMPRNAMQCNVR